MSDDSHTDRLDDLSRRLGFWRKRQYYLDKMSLRELVIAYFQYHAIQVYIVLGVILAVLAAMKTTQVWPVLAAALTAALLYPLVWYLLHRFVLHGRFLFRSPLTARVWKRIHYDHHQDPHNLQVLFGALYTTLPTIVLATGPAAYLIGGVPGGLAGIATGLFATCLYEFCHCIQHLSYKPKSKWLRQIKRLHMAHHFHNEDGNFGITNFFWDKAFATFYASPEETPRSDTVFNLGYTEDEARRYPWVAQLTDAPRDMHPRQRRQHIAN